MSLHSLESSRSTVALKRPRRLTLPSLAAWVDSLSDARLCLVVVALSGLLFVSLFNPYWVPSGDGDLYVAIARSLVLGEGFKFNGQFVNICPPGWPLILAGVMQVSPTFAAFKVVTISAMVGSLAAWFFVLRRFTSPRGAAGAVLLTAVLAHVYSLTFWTHSEAVFCLISTLSLLLALQIAEGRPLTWRLVALLILCVAGVFIRWAAFIQPLLLCAMLLHGKRWWRPESARAWGCCAAVCVVTFSTFFTLRQALQLTPQQEVEQREAGAVFEDVVAAAPRASITADARKVDFVNVTATKDRSLAGELMRRAVESGTWMSWLFWQPFRFAASVRAISWVGIVVGWVIIAALTARVIEAARRRQWLWLGLAAYCTALCINWPNANPRYLVPVAPLLVLGTLQGLKLLWNGSSTGSRRDRKVLIALLAVAGGVTVFELVQGRRLEAALVAWTIAGVWWLRVRARSGVASETAGLAQRAVTLFVGSILLVNGALYAVDLKVAHSRDFYNRYEAGFNDDLVKACYKLNELGLGDAQLAVAERYVNLGRVRKSKYAVRAAVLLTGKSVQTIRDKWAGEPRAELLRWCQRRRIEYYLDQRPSVPWRVWHFILPRWLNEWLVQEPLGPDSEGWVLYRIRIEPVPVVPPTSSTTVAQRLIDPRRRFSWPTTAQATEPGTEFRRSADRLDLPNIENWPTRVPGL
ncbi:MAG: hypothetical protein NZ561_03870 [Phycisphaerae bacterium]|nr:hypothetical protein [Phycisphaerae bacterium]MDW8261517.1 hypothetical protein [Phycisphaerales bacterium]